MDLRDPIEQARARMKRLEDQHRSWFRHCREIVDFILPYHGQFPEDWTRSDMGRKKGRRIVDASATKAVSVAQAGMHTGLTSPGRPWFALTLSDPELMDMPSVRDYLRTCERLLYSAFGQSNFYHAVQELYPEILAFGAGCFYEEAHPQKRVRFVAHTIGQYLFERDALGQVDTVYRNLWMTARQMVQRFGEGAVSESVRQSLDQDPDKRFRVVHCVTPRDGYDPFKADRLNMPYQSLYFEHDGGRAPLAQGGYQTMPYMVPCWQVIGGNMGLASPGMHALPDVKMLQEMKVSYLMAVHKSIDPPVNVPSQYKDALQLLPGGINSVSDGNTEAVRPTYLINPRLGEMLAAIQEVQQSVREGFFNDLFLSLEAHPNMTATEVLKRHEEKLLRLGPVIERLQVDLFDPLMDRTLEILGGQGLLPPPPIPELQGLPLKVDYTSPLAQAQKMVWTQGIQESVLFTGELARQAMKPELLDNFDLDAAARLFHEYRGAPLEMLRTKSEVARLRAEREKAMAAQAGVQKAAGLIAGARQLASIDTSGKNALTDLAGAALKGGGS